MESTQKSEEAQPGSLSDIATIAWPIVISMLSYTAMGVTDTLFVGRLGTAELAGVGLAGTLVFLMSSFALGLLQGIKIMVAQATGAKLTEKAIVAGWQGLWIALPLGALVVASGEFDTVIFSIMGGSDAIQGVACTYFVVRVFAAPFSFVLIALGNYFQGVGDTRTPMIVNLVANGLNIALDAVLIFGLGPIEPMGVVGAAWATVIATGIGMLLMVIAFVNHVGWSPQWDFEVVYEALELGLPVGVQDALDIGSWTVFTAVLARMGEAELAAHQIAIQVLSVSFLPGHGIGEAACILAGQYIGAGNVEAVRKSFISALKLSCAVMGAMGLIFWFMPDPLILVFVSDPEVLIIGRELLMLAALFQLFDAVVMTAFGALKGVGDTQFTMWASLGASWLVLLPVAWFFGVYMGMGATGAWIGLTLYIVFLAVVAVVRFNSGGWAVVSTSRVQVG